MCIRDMAGVLRLEAVDGNLKNKRVCLTEQGEALLGLSLIHI